MQEQSIIEQNTYALLCEYEAAALPRRVQRLTSEVDAEAAREASLQSRYRDLQARKQQLLAQLRKA